MKKRGGGAGIKQQDDDDEEEEEEEDEDEEKERAPSRMQKEMPTFVSETTFRTSDGYPGAKKREEKN